VGRRDFIYIRLNIFFQRFDIILYEYYFMVERGDVAMRSRYYKYNNNRGKGSVL